MVLAYIFKLRFSRDIGLKFWGVVGSLPGFGSVIMRAVNDSLANIKEEAALLKSFIKWGSRYVENCLKYSPVRSSRPGVFPGGSEAIVARISVAENGAFKEVSCFCQCR